MHLKKSIIVGIDATNIQSGGGVAHIVETINSFEGHEEISKIIVWGARDVLGAIRQRNFIVKLHFNIFEKNIFFRFWWQLFVLKKEISNQSCSVLISPGGYFFNINIPVFVISQNLLPFCFDQILKYFPSFLFLKLILLRIFQTISFRRASGVIFLSQYAKDIITKSVGQLKNYIIIPHGINKRFFRDPLKLPFNSSSKKKIKIIYVSTIDKYKNQDIVIRAISKFRDKYSIDVELDLIGGSYKPSLKAINKLVLELGDAKDWVNIYKVPFDSIHDYYHSADIAIFASSCENMPNILLEYMASGLPIICSNMPPMNDILGIGGLYFDAKNLESLENVLHELISNPLMQRELSSLVYQSAKTYKWEKSSEDLFSYVIENYSSIKKLKD